MSENTIDLADAVSCTTGFSKLSPDVVRDIAIFQNEPLVGQSQAKNLKENKSVKLADTPDSVHAGCPTRDRH
jgi:hypothetical protein